MERGIKKTQPILMAEEYWRNSHLSVARFYGGCQFMGKNYVLINKHGITIFELSNPESRHYVGDGQMAIPPGEPADLIQSNWLPIYKEMGREEFIKMIREVDDITLEKARAIMKQKKQCTQ